MTQINLNLSQDATRNHIKELVLAYAEDPKAIEEQVAEAHIPSDHSHDIGVVNARIDSLQGIPETVKKRMKDIYLTLAEAESHVHGVEVSKTHFHEVGDAKAMKDILTICLALDQIKPERISSTHVQTGKGKVKCAHGILDIPAPATKAILDKGIPCCEDLLDGERCTPTSAAIIWTIVDDYDYQA